VRGQQIELRALPAAVETFERDQAPAVHGCTPERRSHNAETGSARNIEVLDTATKIQTRRRSTGRHGTCSTGDVLSSTPANAPSRDRGPAGLESSGGDTRFGVEYSGVSSTSSFRPAAPLPKWIGAKNTGSL
jgi:hypothetical protein